MKKLVGIAGTVGTVIAAAALLWAKYEGDRLQREQDAHEQKLDDEEWRVVVKDFLPVTPEEHEAVMNALTEVLVESPDDTRAKLSLVCDEDSHG